MSRRGQGSAQRAPSVDPARLAAYDVLVAVREDDAYANLVLPQLLRERRVEGRDAVGQVLGAVMETFEDFRYTDELEGQTAHALVFKARVGAKDVEGIDLLRFDGEGKIRDFTVLVRPLSATIALAEAMGPKVAHLKGAR